MLGIIIGISSVIMIISIGNGVKGGINSELNAMVGGQIYVYSDGQNDEGISVEFTDEDIDALQTKVANVKAVTPRWTLSGTVTGRKGIYTASMSLGMPGLEYVSSDPIIAGRYFNENDYYSANKVCVVTEASARAMFGTTNVVGMTFDFTMYGSTQEFTLIGIRKDNASVLVTVAGTETVSVEAPLSAIREAGFDIVNDALLIISDGAEKKCCQGGEL